mmetsp:Transcript_62337/g.150254  ORF Transcript_62337/g.150254 Transcript_62337/m.150254 type:complete len:168 (-) Transcript_62337:298-801(-)
MRCVSALVLALAAPSAADYGILDLDNTTFDRVVGQGLAVLVRVDKEYPYGDSDDAWKEVGAAVGSSDAKLLLAHVGVSDTPSPYKGEEYQGEGGGGEEEEREDRRGGRDRRSGRDDDGDDDDDDDERRDGPVRGGDSDAEAAKDEPMAEGAKEGDDGDGDGDATNGM